MSNKFCRRIQLVAVTARGKIQYVRNGNNTTEGPEIKIQLYSYCIKHRMASIRQTSAYQAVTFLQPS